MKNSPSESDHPQLSSLADPTSAPNQPKPNAAKGYSSRANIIDRLFADQNWIENYRVTADEKIALSNAAMMGEVSGERDVLFILNQIRRARLRW
jgi:hypothetical protein